MPPPAQQEEKRQAAREIIDILHEISILLVRFVLSFFYYSLLPGHRHLAVIMSMLNLSLFGQNTHLDRTEVSLCVSLVENGVNPEALAVSYALW